MISILEVFMGVQGRSSVGCYTHRQVSAVIMVQVVLRLHETAGEILSFMAY